MAIVINKVKDLTGINEGIRTIAYLQVLIILYAEDAVIIITKLRNAPIINWTNLKGII